MSYTTLATLGRMLLSFIFIFGGMQKILNWDETERTFFLMVTRWLEYGQGSWWQFFFEHLLQNSFLWLTVLTTLQLLGGILLFLGINICLGALLSFIFLAFSNFYYHSFWLFQGPERQLQLILFLYNISLLGGILLALAGCRKSCSSDVD
jgi:uncharacterized membrane protein YphA (DoxX/SURF4 family)